MFGSSFKALLASSIEMFSFLTIFFRKYDMRVFVISICPVSSRRIRKISRVIGKEGVINNNEV